MGSTRQEDQSGGTGLEDWLQHITAAPLRSPEAAGLCGHESRPWDSIKRSRLSSFDTAPCAAVVANYLHHDLLRHGD